MKRVLTLLLVLAFTVTMFAGCGTPAPVADKSAEVTKAPETTVAPAEKPKADAKVKFRIWELQDFKPYMDVLIKEYAGVNPNVTVDVTYNSTDDQKNNLKVAASSGTMPDAWFMWGGTFGGFFADNGLTADLTALGKEKKLDESYLPAFLQLCTYNGKLSGIPRNAFGMGFVYRKDIFDKYGLKAPTTIAEFEKVCDTLKANNITPISTGGKFGWHVMRIVEGLIEGTAGSELRDKIVFGQESWDNPAVVAAFAKFKSWVDKGYFPKGFLTLDPNEAKLPLYAGKAALQLEGPWFDNLVRTDKQDAKLYGFFPMPTDQAKIRMSGFTEMTQFSAKAPKEVFEAAVSWHLWWNSKEVVNKHSDILSFPRAAKGTTIPADMIITKGIADAMESGGTYQVTDQALSQEAFQKFLQAQDGVASGGMTPEKAAKFLQEEITKLKK